MRTLTILCVFILGLQTVVSEDPTLENPNKNQSTVENITYINTENLSGNLKISTLDVLTTDRVFTERQTTENTNILTTLEDLNGSKYNSDSSVFYDDHQGYIKNDLPNNNEWNNKKDGTFKSNLNENKKNDNSYSYNLNKQKGELISESEEDKYNTEKTGVIGKNLNHQAAHLIENESQNTFKDYSGEEVIDIENQLALENVEKSIVENVNNLEITTLLSTEELNEVITDNKDNIDQGTQILNENNESVSTEGSQKSFITESFTETTTNKETTQQIQETTESINIATESDITSTKIQLEITTEKGTEIIENVEHIDFTKAIEVDTENEISTDATTENYKENIDQENPLGTIEEEIITEKVELTTQNIVEIDTTTKEEISTEKINTELMTHSITTSNAEQMPYIKVTTTDATTEFLQYDNTTPDKEEFDTEKIKSVTELTNENETSNVKLNKYSEQYFVTEDPLNVTEHTEVSKEVYEEKTTENVKDISKTTENAIKENLYTTNINLLNEFVKTTVYTTTKDTRRRSGKVLSSYGKTDDINTSKYIGSTVTNINSEGTTDATDTNEKQVFEITTTVQDKRTNLNENAVTSNMNKGNTFDESVTGISDTTESMVGYQRDSFNNLPQYSTEINVVEIFNGNKVILPLTEFRKTQQNKQEESENSFKTVKAPSNLIPGMNMILEPVTEDDSQTDTTTLFDEDLSSILSLDNSNNSLHEYDDMTSIFAEVGDIELPSKPPLEIFPDRFTDDELSISTENLNHITSLPVDKLDDKEEFMYVTTEYSTKTKAVTTTENSNYITTTDIEISSFTTKDVIETSKPDDANLSADKLIDNGEFLYDTIEGSTDTDEITTKNLIYITTTSKDLIVANNPDDDKLINKNKFVYETTEGTETDKLTTDEVNVPSDKLIDNNEFVYETTKGSTDEITTENLIYITTTLKDCDNEANKPDDVNLSSNKLNDEFVYDTIEVSTETPEITTTDNLIYTTSRTNILPVISKDSIEANRPHDINLFSDRLIDNEEFVYSTTDGNIEAEELTTSGNNIFEDFITEYTDAYELTTNEDFNYVSTNKNDILPANSINVVVANKSDGKNLEVTETTTDNLSSQTTNKFDGENVEVTTTGIFFNDEKTVSTTEIFDDTTTSVTHETTKNNDMILEETNDKIEITTDFTDIETTTLVTNNGIEQKVTFVYPYNISHLQNDTKTESVTFIYPDTITEVPIKENVVVDSKENINYNNPNNDMLKEKHESKNEEKEVKVVKGKKNHTIAIINKEKSNAQKEISDNTEKVILNKFSIAKTNDSQKYTPEPSISGYAFNNFVNITVNIKENDTNFYVPPNAVVKSNDQFVNITWKSNLNNMNNSLTLFVINKEGLRRIQEIQLNIIKDGEMMVYERNVAIQEKESMQTIDLDEGMEIQISNFDFLKSDINASEVLRSSTDEARIMLQVQVAIICLTVTVIFAVILIVIVKRMKQRALKNEEATTPL